MRYGERLMRETAERGLKRTVSQTGRRAGGGVSAGRDRETDRLTPDDSQTQTPLEVSPRDRRLVSCREGK